MRELFEELNELYRIDEELFELNRKKAGIPARIETVNEQLAERRGALTEAEEELAEMNRQIGELEESVESASVRLKHAKDKLLEIKNNKEYRAMLQEISNIQKSADDDQLKALELGETRGPVEEKVQGLQTEFSGVEEEFNGRRQALEEELAATERRLEEVTAQRTAQLEKIKPDVRARYSRVHQRRGGRGISRTVDSVCHACNMNIPPQIYQRLLSFQGVETCPFCHVLLIPPMDEAQDPAETEAEAEGAPAAASAREG